MEEEPPESETLDDPAEIKTLPPEKASVFVAPE